ncbi:MAG: winged helix DNA-binding domain-containing protein [Chloroflexi bacterium]|nr:winged helix DNA-binding domain-containing protein [Chloroflexota bacterium]
MAEPVLSPRALNRTLLDRQMLLERSPLSLTQAAEQMGGIQTQYAPAGYIGLWARMRDFDRPLLTQALVDRTVIQATVMRATIHMVSAADYWPMTAGIRRIRREWFEKVSHRQLEGTDMEAVANAVREELADGPLSMRELTSRIVARGYAPRTAAWAGMRVDLVRVPPAGTWERRRADVYGLADAWLPAVEVSEDEGMELLIRRYLGAFGPAPLKDIASWMGVNVGQMRQVADRMGLRTLRDEAGKPLLDLPGASLPDPETPAPVRFLAVWDAALLVHARRTLILPEELRPQVFNTKTPHSVNTFLVDGQVAGAWRFETGEIQLSPLRELHAAERREVEEEAHRLSIFHS